MLLLCHCVLNVNSRAPGIARWSNIIKPVWDIIRARNLQFIQLPCLEAAYLGLRRWWFVKEQYRNALFKDLCQTIGVGICEILKKNNVKKVKLIGLGISPTCGYRETQSDPSWGGKPREVNLKNNITEGPGILIEILSKILKDYGFIYEVYDLPPCMIYPDERAGVKKYPRNFEESIEEVSEFLGFDYRSLELSEYDKFINYDIRSGRIFICPHEALAEQHEVVDRYIEDGYGLISIPRSDTLTFEEKEVARIFALQVENHLDVGHRVILYRYEKYSALFDTLVEFLKDRNLLEKISILSF
ncbi:MAG: hypothetical protein QW724_07200 [Nitrososphaerota archaeon]